MGKKNNKTKELTESKKENTNSLVLLCIYVGMLFVITIIAIYLFTKFSI